MSKLTIEDLLHVDGKTLHPKAPSTIRLRESDSPTNLSPYSGANEGGKDRDLVKFAVVLRFMSDN